MHGPVTYSTISNFLKRVYLSSPFGQETPESFRDTSTSATSEAVIHQVTSNETWYKACPPSRGICVVYLTNTESGYNENILKSIANSNTGVASAVSLLHVDGECQLSFTEHFGLSVTILPTLVVYAPSKSRYTVFKGSLSEVSDALIHL